MATKTDERAFRMAEIYEIRMFIDDSDKESYTKEEILKLLDEQAKKVMNYEN